MNNQKINALRLNLTVMNTIVLIGLSFFIAVVFFVTLRLSRDTEINNTLEAYCAQLAGETEANGKGTSSAALASGTIASHSDFQDALAKNAVTYVLWDEHFRTISGSESLSLDEDHLKAIIKRYIVDGEDRYWIANYQTTDKNLRICTTGFVSDDGALKIVQVIKDMSGERNIWSGSLWIMLGAVAVSALAAAFCGYFLSGRSLIPIKENMIRQQEFMADASHELRTPIAVIRTNLEVVRESENEPVSSQLEWLNNAYAETKRMHHIVEDMMFLARADAHELPVELMSVDLGFLVVSVAERLMPMAMEKEIVIRTEMPDEELMLLGDEKQLTQLLVILIDNAIKYSDSTTEITVRADRKDQNLCLQVLDRGIGLPEAEKEKIFERFYRVDKARSRAAGGTGLGLSIAATIVAGHKGTIKALSREGGGSVIEVILPLRKESNLKMKNSLPGQTERAKL